MAYKRISPQPVVEGGTGASTLTGVLTGNGTSAVTANAVTQYGTVIAGASNAVSSVAPSATSGVPYISQGATSNPTFGTAVVAGGGTGNTTFTPYSIIAAGTTATGPFQNVVGVGTSGQVLTSAGAGALPTWQTLGGASITITGDTGGPISSGSFTFAGGSTGLSFNGSGTTFTTTFAGITANGGTVSLATDATTSTVNIGTGAGAKTVTLGSTNTTSTTNLQSGSGGIKIPAFTQGALVTSTAGVISTVTGTAGFVLTANTGAAPSFQAPAASSITITGDTGGGLTGNSFTFSGGTTGLSFGGSGTTETLTFAGITANGGTVSLATDATTSTINVGTGAGVKTSTFGSTNSTSATTVQSGSGALNITSTNGALTINSGTGTLGISTDAAATTVNVGTGGAAKTVTLGSTNSTSTTNLQSGSGGIKIPAFAEGALVTSSSGVISTVTGTAGYVLTANGAGVAPSFQVAGGGGTTWSVITADQTAAVNNGYICNKGSTLNLALPTTSAVGSILEVTGINNATGWKITQAASQQIHFGSSDTTAGTGGSLASSATRDSVRLVCVVANLEWNVLSAQGNLTVT